jgi:hypothetical protein
VRGIRSARVGRRIFTTAGLLPRIESVEDMTMMKIDTHVGIVGDLHSNVGVGVKAIRNLVASGVKQVHFLGDFGFVWAGGQRQNLALKPISAALKLGGAVGFVTGGNHEGYDEWDAIEPDADGIRWIRKNIGLLPRGWRAESPAGNIVASLGGANSIDMPYRVRSRSGWWPQEQITEDDLAALGRDRVDILLGHDAPLSPTLASRLFKNQHLWEPEGLRYAELGHAMFHRGFTQVRPRMSLAGHYHLFQDVVERYRGEDDKAFETRVIVMNADGHFPTTAVLDTDTLVIEFQEFVAGQVIRRA